MAKQLENQCDTITTHLSFGGVTIQTQYILMDSYNKLKHELEKSEEQVRILHSQIRQNEKLKEENEGLKEEIKILNKRIDELTEEIGPLRGIATEFSRMKIYQRVAEKLSDVCDGMYTLLCDNKSHIYKNSGDDKLSVLVRHLQEFNNTRKYARWSKVRDNRELWNTINKETRKILQDEFNIKDINVFYEIVRIKSTRNNLYHTKDEATIDEIRTITKYATEIVDCISFNDSLN